ncbi:MAG: serine/threonine protein phosphatase [Synergistales bacterium]|nr:serine/threonine protein phosphatase [Synergistales bacterium]
MESYEERLKISTQLNMSLKGRVNSYVERSRDMPVLIVGDLHGEMDSVHFILENFELDQNLLIFLGDYVDRGKESLELLSVLFDLQARRPGEVILLRGNHEDWGMNLRYGFARELSDKGKDLLYKPLLSWYESLPLMARIGEIMALHGGPPYPLPGNMDDLKKLTFQDERSMHILWSDPEDESYYPRGGGTRSFNRQELDAFLSLAQCQCMVRGHQYIPSRGYKINFRKCVTLFTATYGMGWSRSVMYLPEGPIQENLEQYIATF